MLLCSTICFCLAGLSILLPYVTISSLPFTTWDNIGHCQYHSKPSPARTDGQIVEKPNLEDLLKEGLFQITEMCWYSKISKNSVGFLNHWKSWQTYFIQNENRYIVYVSVWIMLKKSTQNYTLLVPVTTSFLYEMINLNYIFSR